MVMFVHNLGLTLFMLGWEMGHSFIMALLSMCLVAYSEVSLMFWKPLLLPISLLLMQSTKLQDILYPGSSRLGSKQFFFFTNS